jgi:signal transduction histidine kinase
MVLQAKRHLLLIFFATVLVLVAALVWMGLQLLRQDRALARQRVREQCEAAADLAVASLQEQLSRTEEQLTALSAASSADLAVAAPAFAGRLAADSVLLVLHAGGMDAYPEHRLLFVPDADPPPPVVGALFAHADALEFRRQAFREAIAALGPLARHADPAVRAEAQLRLARCLWKSGDSSASLAAYEGLARFRSLPVMGLPAEVAAHEGRMLVFEARGDRNSLQREAAALCGGLRSGDWRLSRRAYEFYRNEACGRIGSPPPDPPEALALALAAGETWANRRAGGAGRRIVWHENTPILLVWRSGAGRTAVAALGRRHIEADWLKPRPGARLALSDPEGRIVAGAAARAAVPQTVRLASATRLPWTLHASASEDGQAGALPARQRLVMTALLTLVLLVLAGIYFIGRAAARELEVGRLQSDFVASISHEFRTPITALRQLSEMLAGGRAVDDVERQEFYRAMAAESERLHRLVEGLLNFGRLEAGAIEFRMETLDAAEFLTSVVAEFRKSAEAREYEIELDAGGTPPRVRCDRAALACVLWNLLENAVKYSPDCRRVWVGLAREGLRAVIRIRDRGIGIPPAEQKRIFQKFVRGAGATSRSIRGAGVGLAIAGQIVAAHHGAIAVESVPGEGSVFSVLLPEVD